MEVDCMPDLFAPSRKVFVDIGKLANLDYILAPKSRFSLLGMFLGNYLSRHRLGGELRLVPRNVLVSHMLESYLQEMGLTDKEAAIYLALLQMGTISVMDLAKQANINRSTSYFILESLGKKGLASEVIIGKKTYYQAAPPERLETYVEQQKNIFDERFKRVKEIIPQLKSVEHDKGERPVVKYFEGWEGVVSAGEELYDQESDGTPVYIVFSKDLLDSTFTKDEVEKMRNTRLKQKIKSKVFYTSEKDVLQSDVMRECIRLDGKYPISCDIAVYKTSVRISILGKNPSGIFVKSKEFADTMKSLLGVVFDLYKK